MAHSATNYDTSALGSFHGLRARISKLWTDYKLYSATVRELQGLSDRELADLGIHRASINGIARESVYQA